MIFVAITAVLLVCLMAMVAALASAEGDHDRNPFPLDEGDAPCGCRNCRTGGHDQ